MATRGKFTLKPSALSQHTANFNKILEQVPVQKIENIELIKRAEIKSVEQINQKETINQENQDSEKKFVFGEQLTDRVVNADKSETESSANEASKEDTTEVKPPILWSGQTDIEDKFDNDLYTILRMNCKLFVLESDKVNWAERGYGVLKLIDTVDGSNCKIMMWTDKCFRLILNTKLFDKMQIDRANKKSIRFNAFDSGTIRIFLIKTSNPNDCEELYDLLQTRLSQYTSKLSISQTSETSKENKNVVFKCDCKLYKENEDESRTANLELYSFTDPLKPSRSHQLFLDIINKDTESEIYLSTYLKLIKITKQITKNSEYFEFEIDDYSYTSDSTNDKLKYRISIIDKENENQIMELFRKEPKIRMDDSSTNGFDREDEETQEEDQESYNDESNEVNRKSDSLNESDRSDTSSSSSDDQKSNTNYFDQETGETKRKRTSETDSESESNFKKQEFENDANSSHKRTAEESSSQEFDSSKKTRIDQESQN